MACLEKEWQKKGVFVIYAPILRVEIHRKNLLPLVLYRRIVITARPFYRPHFQFIVGNRFEAILCAGKLTSFWYTFARTFR